MNCPATPTSHGRDLKPHPDLGKAAFEQVTDLDLTDIVHNVLQGLVELLATLHESFIGLTDPGGVPHCTLAQAVRMFLHCL